jgi:hypothetical protein
MLQSPAFGTQPKGIHPAIFYHKDAWDESMQNLNEGNFRMNVSRCDGELSN